MSQDRRVITDNEILALAEWYLRKEIEKAKDKDSKASNVMIITNEGGVPVFKMELLDAFKKD